MTYRVCFAVPLLLLAALAGRSLADPPVYTPWPFDAAEAGRRRKETSSALGAPIEITNTIGMTLTLIPAGEFDMGSRPGEDRQEEDSQPVHRVKLSTPFYIGQTEVTQQQFETVMGMNPSDSRGALKPVERVGWPMAVEFCKKLSQKEGRTYRLPTEAEWEYACRAGTNTCFSYGDDGAFKGDGKAYKRLDSYAWFGKNANMSLWPVKSKKPNAWGLYDMHGSVWEWCSDWYGEDYYAKSPKTDPTGPPVGTARVLRGGSFISYAWNCTSPYRSFFSPEYRDRGMGLRVVLVIPKTRQK